MIISLPPEKVQKVVADGRQKLMSKTITRDRTDWQLNPAMFAQLEHLWEPFHVCDKTVNTPPVLHPWPFCKTTENEPHTL